MDAITHKDYVSDFAAWGDLLIQLWNFLDVLVIQPQNS